ncbi:MAG: polysaccharide biosynthesis tyrosine autokinase [Burkholderiaceae bacterium]
MSVEQTMMSGDARHRYPRGDSDRGRAFDQLVAAASKLAQTLRRNWGRIAIFVLASLLLGVLVAILRTPVYDAETSLLIRTDKSRVVAIDEPGDGLRRSEDDEGFATEIQFIRSREVGLRVVRELNLSKHPLFVPDAQGNANRGFDPIGSVLRTVRGALRSVLARKQINPSLADVGAATDPAEERALATYLDDISAEPVRNSRVIRIRFRSTDPALAARVANATALTYVRAELELRSASSHSATSGLSSQIKALSGRVRESERRLDEFRERHGLTPMDTVDRRQLLANAEELARQVLGASVRTAEAAQQRSQAGSGNGTDRVLGVPLGDSVVRARQALDEASRSYRLISSQYGSAHPQYQAAFLAQASARQAYERQVNEQMALLERNFETAQAAETSLRAAHAEAVRKLEIADRHSAELTTLVQDVETNRALYRTFLARIKEVQAADDVRAPSADVIDVAVTPNAPNGPSPMFIVAFFGLIGLGTGCLVVYARHHVHGTIDQVSDVGTELGVAALAALPAPPLEFGAKRGRMVLKQPAHPFSEGIRTLAAALEFGRLDRGIKTFAITSSRANEGKEAVISNLAIALARSHRVLVIDADPRSPAVADHLGVDRDQPGMKDMLDGRVKARDAIRRSRFRSLYVMTNGSPDGRHGGLTLVALRRLVRTMARHFDLVLINGAPTDTQADALIISGSCEQTVLVARAHRTPTKLVAAALQSLATIGSNVLGVVLVGIAAADRPPASAHRATRRPAPRRQTHEPSPRQPASMTGRPETGRGPAP